MNHRLLALTSLTLTSAALACPVKPGTLGNGLMPSIAGMRPECGANYQQFKKGATLKGQWAEMYSLPITGSGDAQKFSAALTKMTGTLTQKGYTFFKATDLGADKDAPRLLTYINKKTKLVFGYLVVREGTRMTVALTGTGK